MKKILEIKGRFPGINGKYKLNTREQRLFLSPQYRQFKEMIFNSSMNEKINPPIHIYIEITTYKDIDACIKPILDGLQNKVIKDDKDIIQLTIKKIPIKRNSVEHLRVFGECVK